MSKSFSWATLQKPVIESLLELSDCIVRIALCDDNDGYVDIGPHVRHCLDYFHAVKAGARRGVIDYNTRHRGGPAERRAEAALRDIADVLLWLRTVEIDDKPVRVFAEYSNVSQLIGEFSSTLLREMLHVTEHTIHHTAFIVAIAASRDIDLGERAGVAAATQSFRRRRALN
jgi:hypothetical protein